MSFGGSRMLSTEKTPSHLNKVELDSSLSVDYICFQTMVGEVEVGETQLSCTGFTQEVSDLRLMPEPPGENGPSDLGTRASPFLGQVFVCLPAEVLSLQPIEMICKEIEGKNDFPLTCPVYFPCSVGRNIPFNSFPYLCHASLEQLCLHPEMSSAPLGGEETQLYQVR